MVRRKGHSCEPSSQLISFADYGFATVTGFTLFAKNSPPDCFLNAKTLSGFESLQPEIIKIAKQINICFAILVRRKGHSCEPSSQLISFADYGFATVTGFTLFAKNSPPDCFLNAKTLSGFESLQPKVIKIAKQINIYFAILVRRKGLEPPTYWFVASHSIQLSYRRIPQAVFACEQYYNTFLLKMQVFFT